MQTPLKNAYSYIRAPETRDSNMPYEEKFAQLIELCDHASQAAEQSDDGPISLIVAWPWVLGDTHSEMTESLSRIQKAGLSLRIVHGLQ